MKFLKWLSSHPEMVAAIQLIFLGPFVITILLANHYEGALPHECVVSLRWLWAVTGTLCLTMIWCIGFLYCTRIQDE